MKNITQLIVLFIVLQLGACKDKENETQVKTKMLTAAPWSHAQVTHSDGDLSSQYTNFVIVFSKNGSTGFDGTFIISNGGHAFSENAGNWRFDDGMNKIIFDSGKEMDIELSSDQLTLDFTVPPTGGKVTGLSGHFVFELQPL